MFDNVLQDARKKNLEQKVEKLDEYDRQKYERATRFLDMQNIINQKLAAGQASVDNAQNYPSTWSTNPDGGANGQV